MRSLLVAGDGLALDGQSLRDAAAFAEVIGGAVHVLVGISGEADRACAAVDAARSRSTVPWSVERVEVPLREAVVSRCARTAPDLVLLPLASGDPAAIHEVASIVLRFDGPIVVTKGRVRLPPRRALLPLGESDVEAGALEGALEWMRALGRADEGRAGPASEPAELQVMWLRGIQRSRAAIALLERRLAAVEEMGSAPRVRIRRRVAPAVGLRWMAGESPDLLMLRRHEIGARIPSQDELLWLRILLAARAPTLLLPRQPALASSPAPGVGDSAGRWDGGG